MPAIQLAGWICLLLASQVSCAIKPISPSKLPTGIKGTYPFGPDSITIHPLTRYWISESGEHEVEARVEFQDLDGFPTRGVGRLTLTLESTDGRVVETWILPLDNLESNRSYFDDVTRTYLVRLSLPDSDMPKSGELQATLLLPDGDELEATGKVATPTHDSKAGSSTPDGSQEETP